MLQNENMEINEIVLTLNQSAKKFRLTKGLCVAGNEYYFYDENQNVLTIKPENGHLIMRLIIEDKS